MEFDFTQQPGLEDRTVRPGEDLPPLVSVITPYFNGGKHLRQTFRSVVNQTFPWFEWIIVDDGSTKQEDLDLLNEIAGRDGRIRVYHKENGGISSARNYAIARSCTDYILPLDSDDLLEPPFLEYCWWMLQKNPGAAWAYTESVGFQGQEYVWRHPFDPIRLKKENHLTATALIRKQALLDIGCYDDSHKHYNEDWYAWLKIVARGGYPAQSSGDPLFWYRRNDTGVLSIVREDPAVKRENQEMISAAAAQVTDPRPPVLYPRSVPFDWSAPKLSDWDRHTDKGGKTHILFLFPHLEMGGADKFNLDLISRLDPQRFETGIITTVPAANTWQQAFRKVTSNIFNLPNFCDSGDYAEFVSYYLKSRRVDILFVSNAYLGYYMLPWLREHFPKLAIVDYVHMEEWYWRGGGYARTSAMAANVTEKTYVCNSATRNVMLSHFGRTPESVETVHIGIDAARYCRDAVPAGQLYRVLGLEPTRPVVLFICRLHPQKRPFLMLEIARKVAQKIPDVVFAVVGGGPQEAELKAAATGELKHTVYFLGARKDVRPYYRDAKAVLICSLKEGLSLTAYESCAMGVPVISADVGGQKDLIDDSVGKLIPCLQSECADFDQRKFSDQEVAAYAEALVTLLSNPALQAEKSRCCVQKVQRSFTLEAMVDRFQQEFQRLTRDASVMEKRMEMSRRLQQCAPLPAELYVSHLRAESLESELRHGPAAESVLAKGKRVLKEDGPAVFLKKTAKWFANQLRRS